MSAFRRRYWLLTWLAPATSFVVLLSLAFALPNAGFVLNATVLFVSWVAVMQFLWRMKCPNCGNTAGRHVNFLQRICPHCGRKIL